MNIMIKLVPNSGKGLDDTVCDMVDNLDSNVAVKLAIKAGYRTTGVFGDDATNTVVSWFNGVVMEITRKMLKDNHIYAEVKKITVEKEEETLRLALEVDHIQYEKSLIKNLKRIVSGLQKLPEDHIVRTILDILQEDKEAVVSALLSAISDEKKEDIIKVLVEKYHDNLCSLLTNLINENKINLAIVALTLS